MGLHLLFNLWGTLSGFFPDPGNSVVVFVVVIVVTIVSPVSYTHLDVYKRQVLNCSLMISPFFSRCSLSSVYFIPSTPSAPLFRTTCRYALLRFCLLYTSNHCNIYDPRQCIFISVQNAYHTIPFFLSSCFCFIFRWFFSYL